MISRALILMILSATIRAAEGSQDTPQWRQLWDRASNIAWFAKPEAELRKQANAGNAVAMWVLGWKLHDQKQYDESMRWREKAADAGLPQAMTYKAEGGMTHDDLRGALQILEKAATTGYPEAKCVLAGTFLGGAIDKNQFYVKADPARAVELYQQAADERAVNAFVSLGTLYACGLGEPRNDDERPAALFEKAAHNGHTDAMNEMAERSRNGFGVDKDPLAAAAWAARSYVTEMRRIVGGNPPGPTRWVGSGLDEEDKFLRRVSTLFAEGLMNHSATALMELAALYEAGDHGKPNPAMAAALYTLAERFGQTGAAGKRAANEAKLDEPGRTTLKEHLSWMLLQTR